MSTSGIRFFDNKLKKNVMLCVDGEWSGWIFYENNGNWTSLRKANVEDKKSIESLYNRKETL